MKLIKLLYPSILIFTFLIGITIGFYMDLPKEITITMEYGDSVNIAMDKIDALKNLKCNNTIERVCSGCDEGADYICYNNQFTQIIRPS
jgi:hypothetical protein